MEVDDNIHVPRRLGGPQIRAAPRSDEDKNYHLRREPNPGCQFRSQTFYWLVCPGSLVLLCLLSIKCTHDGEVWVPCTIPHHLTWNPSFEKQL